MPKRYVVAGSTGQSFNVFLQSTANGDGVISMTTDKVKVSYAIGSTGAVTTVALQSTTRAAPWVSGGWVENSSVEMPGVYRLDLPDAALASTPGVTFVVRCSTTSTNFGTIAAEIQVISSAGADMPADFITYKGMAQTSVNIGAMLTSVNAKVTSVDSRLSSMDTMLSSVNAKVTSVDSRLSSMDTMLTSVNAHVTSADANVASVLTKVTSIDSRLTSMDTMLTSVNSHVTSVDSRLSSMDTMLSSVNAKVTSVDAKVSSIDTKVTAIQAQTTLLVFTVANQVDVNIQSVNDVAVQGTGTTTDTWRPV